MARKVEIPEVVLIDYPKVCPYCVGPVSGIVIAEDTYVGVYKVERAECIACGERMKIYSKLLTNSELSGIDVKMVEGWKRMIRDVLVQESRWNED